MNISKNIGENIKRLMEKENVSYRRLSENIGISHPTLIKYVEGEQPIDSERLMSIAKFFSKPFEYFFNNPSDISDKPKFLFRADRAESEITKEDLKDLEFTLNNYISVMEKKTFSFIPPKYNINKDIFDEEVDKYIFNIANEQRKIVGIENFIPENYYKMIDRLGIDVIVKKFNNEKFNGASSFSNTNGSFIIINDNENISEERKIFTLIHEYAHLLFHSNDYDSIDNVFYRNGKYDFNEKVANVFSGYFLMPKNLVQSYIDNNEKIDAFEMKRYFKVSIQTLYMTLNNYKLISKKEYKDFWQWLMINKFKDREPAPMPKISLKDKNNNLFNKMYHLYLDENISTSKISELLGLNIYEGREITKEWTMRNEKLLPLK